MKEKLLGFIKEEPVKERLLDVIKWGLILLIAGAVFYMSYGYPNSYTIVRTGKGSAYKLNKRTGQVWIVSPRYSELIKEGKRKTKSTKKSVGLLQYGIHLK